MGGNGARVGSGWGVPVMDDHILQDYLTFSSFLLLARLDVLERSLSDEGVPDRDLDEASECVRDGLRLRVLETDLDDDRDSEPVDDGVRDLECDERDEPVEDELLRDE